MNDVFVSALGAGASELGLTLSPEQLQMCYNYAQKVRQWNEKINLTTLVDLEEMAIKHFVDSFTGTLAGTWPKGALCADVGTGAGFPGVPMAILRPDTKWVLIDSLGKRVNFLRQAITEIGLVSVTSVHARAEEVGRDKKMREKYDIVVARAVAQLSVLAEYCLPLVRPGGYFIAMKGPGASDEVAAAKKALAILGGGPPKLIELTLPQQAGQRTLVSVYKKTSTPAAYPRRPGIPGKKPL